MNETTKLTDNCIKFLIEKSYEKMVAKNCFKLKEKSVSWHNYSRYIAINYVYLVAFFLDLCYFIGID